MLERNLSLAPRICIMCAKPFSSLATLKKHNRVDHAGEIKCSVCEVIVQTRRNLVRHLQKHKGEKINKTNKKQFVESSSFLCDQCNYTCNQQPLLMYHVKRVHGDERPFGCLYMNCKKSYATRGDLNHHETYSHVKLKMLKCNICDMKFIDKSKLWKHVNQVHTLVGDHHCAQCQKNYRDKQSLEMHIEGVHKKLSLTCSQCQRRFSWRGNLARHMKDVHQKEKTHICNFCGKSFSQNTSLKGHKQSVHVGEEEVAETVIIASKQFHGWSKECQEVPRKLQNFIRREESELANIIWSNVNSMNYIKEPEVCENKELNVMEIGEVFESIDTSEQKNPPPDSDRAKSSLGEIITSKAGSAEVEPAKFNFDMTVQRLNMTNISVAFESSKTKNIQLESVYCSSKANMMEISKVFESINKNKQKKSSTRVR